MEIDTVFKLAAAVAAVVGAAKVIIELSIGGRGRLREEYRFAKEFMDALEENPRIHPFLKEKGYQAIAGDRSLAASEIEYLLSLQKPDRAIRDYVLGRLYLEHLQSAGNLQLGFRGKYKNSWSRNWRKGSYFLVYLVLAILAISPALTPTLFGTEPGQVVVALSFCLVGFGPFAWMALMAAARIHRAELIVKNQLKHTQRILMKSARGSG